MSHAYLPLHFDGSPLRESSTRDERRSVSLALQTRRTESGEREIVTARHAGAMRQRL